MKIELTISWSLGRDIPEFLDRRLLHCLRAIDEAGSLGAATRHLGLSYRHLWGLMKRWEKQCGADLVCPQRGRGAQLAPLGRALLDAQQHILGQLAPDLDRLGAETSRLLTEILDGDRKSALTIIASHDLSLGIFREILSRESGCPVKVQTRGSLDSLRALSEGDCELAGFHFSDHLLATDFEPYPGGMLDERRHCLIRLVSRCQGLMVAAGNPFKLGSLGDVAEQGCRFINRQPGSGTRLLVDGLLDQAGIAPARINGYDNEEFTHLAVAAMIASGAADAGYGIEAAARRFSLGFVPGITEQYCLALDTRKLTVGQLDLVIGILRGGEFRGRIRSLAGYDAEGAGDRVILQRLFSGTGSDPIGDPDQCTGAALP